jgi:hypothetical protein
MRIKWTRWGLATLGLLLLLGGLSAVVSARSNEEYDLSWWTIDGGGGSSSDGDLMLVGTVGQPDAGAVSGGGYTLSGGFWEGPAPAQYDIYIPLLLRNSS